MPQDPASGYGIDGAPGVPRLSGLGRRRVCAGQSSGPPPSRLGPVYRCPVGGNGPDLLRFSLVRIGERHGTIAVVLEADRWK